MMENHNIIAHILAVFIGISLGLLGSGGSIFAIPILVYILKVQPVLATTYSLFVVGISSFVGGLQKAIEKLVDYKKVVLFGLPTLICVSISRKLIVPNIPDKINLFYNLYIDKSAFIMIFFAVVMISAAVLMLMPLQEKSENMNTNLNYTKIIFCGFLIGLIVGFVGTGGGFMIIPALIFLAKTPIKKAVGTSLFIITIQSLFGFLADVQEQNINWKLLLGFTTCSLIGVFIGNSISKKVATHSLKNAFGWFVLFIGIYIFIREILYI